MCIFVTSLRLQKICLHMQILRAWRCTLVALLRPCVFFEAQGIGVFNLDFPSLIGQDVLPGRSPTSQALVLQIKYLVLWDGIAVCSWNFSTGV